MSEPESLYSHCSLVTLVFLETVYKVNIQTYLSYLKKLNRTYSLKEQELEERKLNLIEKAMIVKNN